MKASRSIGEVRINAVGSRTGGGRKANSKGKEEPDKIIAKKVTEKEVIE